MVDDDCMCERWQHSISAFSNDGKVGMIPTLLDKSMSCGVWLRSSHSNNS